MTTAIHSLSAATPLTTPYTGPRQYTLPGTSQCDVNKKKHAVVPRWDPNAIRLAATHGTPYPLVQERDTAVFHRQASNTEVGLYPCAL
jgi:hypothetical protein